MVDLRPDHLKMVLDILRDHVPGLEVRAFGSRVTGTARTASDLDLVVVGQGKLNWKTLANLKDAFEESDLPFRVDVLDWHAVPEHFRENIGRKYEVLQKAEKGGDVASAARLGRGSVDKRRELKLSDAVEINPSVELKRASTYPFVDMQAIFPSVRDVEANEQRIFKSGGSRFRAGDTLMARITPCLENGKIARYKGAADTPAFGSTEFIVLRGREGVTDSSYVYYLTKWEGVSAYAISQMTGSSGRQRVPTSALGALKVKIPSLAEQREIAHILGAFDEKIELNRRMCRTLEAQARALFKSWFVDFDPVRAKAAGKKTGLPKNIEKHFPTRFEDSDIGKVPSGWKILGLDEIAYFLNGLALQKFPPTGDSYLSVIKIAQLRSGDVSGADKASADLESEYIVDDGDVLFSWSGSLECILWTGGKGALNQHLFKVTSKAYKKWLYFSWIHHHLDEFRRIASGKATTMGHIQRHHLTDAKVVIPNRDCLEAMDAVFGPLIEKLIKNQIESRDLARQRDVLLPRFFS